MIQGNGVATLLNASDAGVDIVDGTTLGQDLLRSLVLVQWLNSDGNSRDPISSAVVRTAANYWEGVKNSISL